MVRSGEACVISWPGKYATAWDHLVDSARNRDTSAGVVFLPEGSENAGRHSRIPQSEGLRGKCWCTPLYGEEKDVVSNIVTCSLKCNCMQTYIGDNDVCSLFWGL